jgi:hypothetical protein
MKNGLADCNEILKYNGKCPTVQEDVNKHCVLGQYKRYCETSFWKSQGCSMFRKKFDFPSCDRSLPSDFTQLKYDVEALQEAIEYFENQSKYLLSVGDSYRDENKKPVKQITR